MEIESGEYVNKLSNNPAQCRTGSLVTSLLAAAAFLGLPACAQDATPTPAPPAVTNQPAAALIPKLHIPSQTSGLARSTSSHE